MNTRLMTEDEIRRAGMAALTRAMGPTGAVRFIRQFRKGRGDYTAERASLLGNPTVDEIFRRLKKARSRRPRRVTRGRPK
jgi:hypothetical protein